MYTMVVSIRYEKTEKENCHVYMSQTFASGAVWLAGDISKKRNPRERGRPEKQADRKIQNR